MQPIEDDVALLDDTEVATEWQRRARRDGLSRVMRASQPAALNHAVTEATRTIVSDYLALTATMLGRPVDSTVEVGCGVGRLTPAIAARSGQVTAIDMTERMLAAARESCAGLSNVEFVKTRAERLPLPGRTFDVAVSVWVLMHVLDPERLASVCRALAASCRYLVLIEYEHARVPVSRWSRIRSLDEYLAVLPGSTLVRRTELDYGGDHSAAALIRLEGSR